ncbi:MAG TPA: TonB-dependent receptor [Longimicrobiales bacterium]
MSGKSKYLRALRAAFVVVGTALMVATPRDLNAQGAALRGVVQDTSGAPVAGATVTVEGTRLSVVTGDDGRYRVSGLSERRYGVSVERIGYTAARVAQDAVSASTDAAAFTITLVPSAVDLGAVTVIGSGRATAELREQLRDNPGSVAMIEPRELRATRQANLPDILRYTPGVFAQPRFGAADETQLSVRGSGLRNNFHLRGINLLINGMPYRNADGFTDFESIELLTAQSVQVYKAASAFRFGGSTLGGAVDIETRTGYNADALSVNAQGGAYGFFKGQVSSGGVQGPFDYYASYARTQMDGYRAWSAQQRDRVNLHAGWLVSPNVDARAFYLFADISEELPGSLTAEELAANPRAAVAGNVANRHGRDYTLHHLGVQLRAQLSKTQRIEVAPYIQYRDIVHPIFRVIDQISRDAGTEVRYENTGALGSRQNRLSVGVQYAFGNVDNRNFDNIAGEEGERRKDQLDEAGTLALYLEDRFYATPRLSTVLGLRWASSLRSVDDHFLSDGDQTGRRRFEAFTPRAGLLYELPSVNGQIYANASRTFEPPLLLELNSLATPGFVDVRAQDARQLEVGTRGNAHGWNWDAAVYHITVRDEILNENVQPFPDAPFTVPTYRNAERTRHRGIELGVQRQLGSGLLTDAAGGDILTGRLAYTRSDFRFMRDSAYAGNKLPGAPDHTLDAELTYRHPTGLILRPNVQWVTGDYWVNSANTVNNNGWLVFSGRAEMLIPTLQAKLFVEARNITDRVYAAAVTVDDAAGRSFLPADRRSIYAGVQWQH